MEATIKISKIVNVACGSPSCKGKAEIHVLDPADQNDEVKLMAFVHKVLISDKGWGYMKLTVINGKEEHLICSRCIKAAMRRFKSDDEREAEALAIREAQGIVDHHAHALNAAKKQLASAADEKAKVEMQKAVANLGEALGKATEELQALMG